VKLILIKMALLKLIFFAIIIYYSLKAIGKVFLPFLFNQTVQKINNQQNYKQKREGEITIHFEENKNSKYDKQVGEYIDYEEIKD
jgi:predicted nucleotidyltransferase